MTIKIHDLRPAPGAKTAKTRVGRGEGGKGGKTAGRGTKGTGARKNVPAGFEGGQMPLHMRLPKLKGFRNRFRVEFQVVNVGDLGTLFPDGGTVGPEELAAAGAVRPQQAGQGARQRRPRRRADRQRARVLGQCPRQDHGCGRLGHRAVVRLTDRLRAGSSQHAERAGPLAVSARAGVAVRVACEFRRAVGRSPRWRRLAPVVGSAARASTGGCPCSALSGRP